MANNVSLVSFLFVFSVFILRIEFSEADQMVPAVFVFGDSLVDVGNNNYLAISITKANYPPNGIDFPGKKATGRFCNGKNLADFLAEKLGLSSPPPYLSLKTKGNGSLFITGVNFASAGATIFNGTDLILGNKFPIRAIPSSAQVDYYASVYDVLVKQLGSSGAQQHLSKSIFGTVISSNDLFRYFGSSSETRIKQTPQQYVDLMATKLKGQLKRLYDYGARKFLVAGAPIIGCAPVRRVNPTEECDEEINYWSVKYNEALKSNLQELKSELQGLSYSYFDAYNALNDMIQRPAAYGFNETKAACCGGGRNAKTPCLPVSKYCSNRKDHLFWDVYHPTEAAASIFVDTLFNGSAQYTFPINLQQLVLG